MKNEIKVFMPRHDNGLPVNSCAKIDKERSVACKLDNKSKF